MAIFHLSVKAISRSSGRSATAAAAYRAGEKITDERTERIHDYTRKKGIESSDLVLPENAPDWARDRSKLWNAAELSEKRKDACVAREYEVALPSELTPKERHRLAIDFAKQMANEEGCAVDVCIHAPNKEGDDRNHHAHILRSTRKLEAQGFSGKLETEKAGRKRTEDLEAVREKWANFVNDRLQANGITARVDHRSLEAQRIDRPPTQHLGVKATAIERRTEEPSEKRQKFEAEAAEHNAITSELKDLSQQGKVSSKAQTDLFFEIGDLVEQQKQEEAKAAKTAQEARERAAVEQASAARQRAEIAARQAQAQPPPPQQEKAAFRHDMDYNPAVAVFEATKAIPKNIEALQKVRGMENRSAEDMNALAYQRGIIQERDKNKPQSDQIAALARFDQLAATNPAFVKAMREATADEKPVDRVQQRDDLELGD